MKLMIGLFAALLAAGCVDPKAYESAPVTVQSSKGPVVCQLYTEDQVLWDRAIDMPKGLSVKEADNLCIAEGQRRTN
jgi:uncharacterized lipoprotein YbaY